jgi:hypothetical protein
MLFLFCGSNYYIIDDYNKRDVIAGPTAISDTWPELVKYSAAGADGTSEPFSKKLDAAYFETSSQRLVFFKGNTCVIADYSGGQTSTWESGLINEYFQVGATPVAGMFDASIDGATVGRASNPNVQNTVFLVKQGQYAAGQSTAPRKGSPVKLTHQSTMTQAGWPIPTDDNTTVAAEYVYPPNSQTWESTLFTTTNKGSQSAGDYLVRFYTSTSENAAPNKLWPSFNGAPIDAAVRLDPNLCSSGTGNSGSGNPGTGNPGNGNPGTGNPGNGNPGNGNPGGGNPGNTGPLCCQLPMILQTICNMTALLNKVVDACYPPSSWPTSPYPSGCTGGQQGGGSGCGGTGQQGGGTGGPSGSGCGCGGGTSGRAKSGAGASSRSGSGR